MKCAKKCSQWTAFLYWFSLSFVSMPGLAGTNNAGSIFGHTLADSQIIYQNLDTGVERRIYADSSGRFRIPSVPTGHYQVFDASGEKRNIRVYLGKGTEVDFISLEVIGVVGSRSNLIDVSTVENMYVFDAEDIDRLPLPRNSVAAALLTPGPFRAVRLLIEIFLLSVVRRLQKMVTTLMVWT